MEKGVTLNGGVSLVALVAMLSYSKVCIYSKQITGAINVACENTAIVIC